MNQALSLTPSLWTWAEIFSSLYHDPKLSETMEYIWISKDEKERGEGKG